MLYYLVPFKYLKNPNKPIPLRNVICTVYLAASWFSFAWGIFLIALLALRILAHSPLQKKAENVSDIFFWLASGFLIGNFLNEAATTVMWFAFWAAIIMLLGVSLIIRAFILAVFHIVH
jgi:hypothetical protein